MAKQEKPREENRGTGGSSTSSHGSSGLSSTQSRDGEKTRGRVREGKSGHPDSGNRSGGPGNVTQQSNVETDGGAPSRQTSTASEESGQL